jgi:PHD/YefM family antitoxin component YafN of YafNO toxin-antitoxin module
MEAVDFQAKFHKMFRFVAKHRQSVVITKDGVSHRIIAPCSKIDKGMQTLRRRMNLKARRPRI